MIGAFAITQDIFIIMIGLGVGAFWIRSLTVYLVRQGTLDEYAYLEHGAHWAIGALAVILLVTIKYEISEIITGLIGVVFIAISFVNSIQRNRRIDRESPEHEHPHVTSDRRPIARRTKARPPRGGPGLRRAVDRGRAGVRR